MTETSNHFDVVIIGGGPSGLVSALALQRSFSLSKGQRIKILVLEKRGRVRDRSNTLLLDQAPVTALENLGCDISSFTPSTDFTEIFPDSGTMNQYPLPTHKPVKKSNLCFSALFMIRRKPVFNVGINHLEELLINRVESVSDITLQFNSCVEEIKIREHAMLKMNHGDSFTDITASYVIAADGSHSNTLEKLQLAKLNKPEFLETVISANFSQPGRGNTKYQNCDRSFEALSLASNQGTSVFVKIQPKSNWDGLKLSEPHERESLIQLLKDGAQKLGVYGEIGVGLSILKVVINKSPCSIVGNRVFIIGDARHSGTPRVGLGANVAIMDALRAAQSISLLENGSFLSQKLARPLFQFHSWLGTYLFSSLSRATKRTARVVAKDSGNWKLRSQYWKGQLLMSLHWSAKIGRQISYLREHPRKSLNKFRLAD